jgi:hypothetical protein
MTASLTSLLLVCRRIDGPLLSLWDGCESSFMRSVERLALLNASLHSPSKDLGPPAIERLRGFAVHLMVNDSLVC